MFGLFERPLDPVGDVLELHESDGGGLMGYWMRGHVSRYEFAEAVNRYTGAAEGYDIRYCRSDNPSARWNRWGYIDPPRMPRWVWWRVVPSPGGDESRYHEATPGSRGAFKATVFEWGSWMERERAHMYDEIRRARIQAFTDGINWAVGAAGEEGGKRIIATYHAHQNEIVDAVEDRRGRW